MKLYIPTDIERGLRQAVSENDVNKFGDVASPLRWGKPSWSASQVLRQGLDGDEQKLKFWALELSGHENPSTRRYASRVLGLLWEKNPDWAKQILTTLADDENWLVREEGHAVWSELLTKHFQQVCPILKAFSAHASAYLRRCVAIATRSAGNLRKEELAEPLTRLVEPLLSDKTVYVRKNLGPYTIGDGLLRCYPDITLKHLRRWASNEDEGIRWNVAMSFASYGGSRNWRDGVEILTELAADGRRYVWRAVASALLYLARRHAEVQDTLKTWLNDPIRSKVAEAALRYLPAK